MSSFKYSIENSEGDLLTQKIFFYVWYILEYSDIVFYELNKAVRSGFFPIIIYWKITIAGFQNWII
ncbi:hypothetical protein DW253_09160 [Ruminococcus sp. AM22-13]|nr:hypothetical protein DW253_09160 [Ruminococcus sp. AM22-13]